MVLEIKWKGITKRGRRYNVKRKNSYYNVNVKGRRTLLKDGVRNKIKRNYKRGGKNIVKRKNR